MKPPLFDYTVAESIDGAVAVLSDGGPDTKVLAGGQSLVPMMNFRLARPGRLVDVNRIPGLSYIRKEGGELRIGALARQSSIEHSTLVARGWPLLRAGVQHVAHPQIRNRGTAGGSVAHGDPGGEIGSVLLAYGGHVRLASTRGFRDVAASDLFLGQFMTAIEPDELLVELVLPAQPRRTGASFHEYARRAGDFAIAGVAALVTTADDGSCVAASMALLGVASTPIRALDAERFLQGEVLTPETIDAAVHAATTAVEPHSDVHGSAQFRLRVLKEMVRRSLTTAWSDANGEVR